MDGDKDTTVDELMDTLASLFRRELPPEIEVTREELDMLRACAEPGSELSRQLSLVSVIGVGRTPDGRLIRLVEDGNPFFRIRAV